MGGKWAAPALFSPPSRAASTSGRMENWTGVHLRPEGRGPSIHGEGQGGGPTLCSKASEVVRSWRAARGPGEWPLARGTRTAAWPTASPPGTSVGAGELAPGVFRGAPGSSSTSSIYSPPPPPELLSGTQPPPGSFSPASVNQESRGPWQAREPGRKAISLTRLVRPLCAE